MIPFEGRWACVQFLSGNHGGCARRGRSFRVRDEHRLRTWRMAEVLPGSDQHAANGGAEAHSDRDDTSGSVMSSDTELLSIPGVTVVLLDVDMDLVEFIQMWVHDVPLSAVFRKTSSG
jgi:hypothetical protein